jgi:transketolase
MPTRRENANALRALAMDAVQLANAGHPGSPMGMADIAEVLWRDFLKHNPGNPHWWNRDRFVLSNGHASMLLYALLHLTGYPLALDELRHFRQLGSRTPGHPEREPEIGIETTTGPLGQGLANAVGMALAEKVLAANFNRAGFPIVDHYTYVFVGDGCLMEGISHEVCSLAGTLKLGKLIVVYDDNGISIDGETKGWFTDDSPRRFEAYGWHVIPEIDGHDSEAVRHALEVARAVTAQPSLIRCRTIIGWGAPNKQGTAATHGSPLGADEVAAARRTLGWPYPPFEVPADIRAAWDARTQGEEREAEWRRLFERYEAEHPQLAAEFRRRMAGKPPAAFRAQLERAVISAAETRASVATRQSSQTALNALGPVLPELIGGSADLTGSNNTWRKDSRAINPPTAPQDASGNYIYFGVREFGMTAILSGLALHGGFIPYGGTFLTFSDYARNAVRMAALMKVGSILVYTHDSIGLGEDGPTHQPVEHLASLRLIPNMTLWRPCDAVETAIAWGDAIERRDGPTSLVLTRQAVPHQARTPEQIAAIRCGAYILIDAGGQPECIVLATGSEVGIAAAAVRELNKRGRRVRLVSMPSCEVFARQDPAYREQVLPAAVERRVAVEAGVSAFWRQYVGLQGRVIGLDHFGASGQAADLFKYFGFTTERVIKIVEELLTD